eukprot:9089398-Lingulodinium_polyedra.AAC.1
MGSSSARGTTGWGWIHAPAIQIHGRSASAPTGARQTKRTHMRAYKRNSTKEGCLEPTSERIV